MGQSASDIAARRQRKSAPTTARSVACTCVEAKAGASNWPKLAEAGGSRAHGMTLLGRIKAGGRMGLSLWAAVFDRGLHVGPGRRMLEAIAKLRRAAAANKGARLVRVRVWVRVWVRVMVGV